MRYWDRLWRRLTETEQSRGISLTLPEWHEEAPSKGLRVWHDIDGSVLSLSLQKGIFNILDMPDELEIRRWCRNLAQNRGAGLIEARAVDSVIGPAVTLIY
jgi:hypothetical protein